MALYAHQAAVIDAEQFDPQELPWPEGVLQRADGGWLQVLRGSREHVTAPLAEGDYIEYRGCHAWCVWPRREFEARFRRVEVREQDAATR